MQQQKKTSIKHIISAGVNSYKGFIFLIRHEVAFRQEFILFLPLLAIILYLEQNHLEKLWLVFSLVLILIVETLNTAIEKTIDRINTQHHPLSGLAKDLGSFAVMLSILFAIIVWLVILL